MSGDPREDMPGWLDYEEGRAADELDKAFRPVVVPTRKCIVCGKGGTVTVTAGGLARYHAGALAQRAFPEMPPALREQLITGTHPACWDTLELGDEE